MLWKHEWVVPAEKVLNPQTLKQLRKISLTSEFSLVFEGIIKDWIMEDIQPKVDKTQYGSQKGTSTEHLLVNLMDRILRLLDNNNNHSAVIASMLDWSSHTGNSEVHRNGCEASTHTNTGELSIR